MNNPRTHPITRPGRGLDRRSFLQRATVGAVALSIPPLPKFFQETRMGVVVHSYAHRWHSEAESQQYPGFANALDLLEHCHQLGAGGVQVGVSDWSTDFARKVRQTKERLGLYVEGSVGLPQHAGDEPRFEQEISNAREAGVQVVRTVCLNGRRYETFHSAEDFAQFRKNSRASLQRAEPIVRRHTMKLAVENHKDWRAPELVDMLQQLDSEWIGVTLDFGNSISLLEDPLEVARTLAPYVFSTHVKDMAVEEYADGFRLSEVPLGTGMLDLPAIVALCKKHNPEVTFSLEMITRDPLEVPCLSDAYWAALLTVPGTDLARTLRMVRQQAHPTALPWVTPLSTEDQLAVEEKNVIASLAYGQEVLNY